MSEVLIVLSALNEHKSPQQFGPRYTGSSDIMLPLCIPLPLYSYSRDLRQSLHGCWYAFPMSGCLLLLSCCCLFLLQLDGWQSWFQLLGRKVPTAQSMSDLLRMAWRRGEKKGYHSAKTDFSRIHASGVSRILLKGQSYSTPPGTKSGERGIPD